MPQRKPHPRRRPTRPVRQLFVRSIERADTDDLRIAKALVALAIDSVKHDGIDVGERARKYARHLKKEAALKGAGSPVRRPLENCLCHMCRGVT